MAGAWRARFQGQPMTLVQNTEILFISPTISKHFKKISTYQFSQEFLDIGWNPVQSPWEGLMPHSRLLARVNHRLEIEIGSTVISLSQ